MSNDGQRVFCYTSSNSPPSLVVEGGESDLGKHIRPPFQPVVKVIDTALNEVIATYDWMNSFREAAEGAQLRVVYEPDPGCRGRGDLVVETTAQRDRPFKRQVAVF